MKGRVPACVSGTRCTYECGGICTKTSHPWMQKRTKQWVISFLWEITSEDSGLKNARLAQGAVQNRQQHSASGAVGLIQEHLQLSPPRDSLWDWGMKKQTTPNTQHHQLHTRLNWKRNQTNGLGLETGDPLPSGLTHPDRHGWEGGGLSGDVHLWVGHVTQQTGLPECAKQFSTWVLTAKPQHPNRQLSHQRLKPCSYATIWEMLCCI